MTFGVYQIKNTKNNKIYIGSCQCLKIGIEGRIKAHFRLLSLNRHPNQKLQYSYNKYGLESFEWCILEEVNDFDVILSREKFWLDTTRSYEDEIGFNIARDPLAPMKGRKMTESAKKLIGEKSKNRIVSEETREKIRQSRKNIKLSTRLKLSEASKGRKLTEEQKLKFVRSKFIKRCESRNQEFTEEKFLQYLEERELPKITELKEIKRNPISIETRKKMSESQRKHFAENKRKPITEESRKKMSEAQKKRFKDQEQRDRIWKNRK